MATCIFCDIIDGQAPATFVQTWDDAVALVPREPYTPGHSLVIPRVHVPNAAADPDVTGAVMRRAAELARDMMTSANLLARDTVHSADLLTSWGRQATQTVYHLHVHVIPRTSGDQEHLGLWPWPRWAQLRATFHVADQNGTALCGAGEGTSSTRWADATCPDCIRLASMQPTTGH